MTHNFGEDATNEVYCAQDGLFLYATVEEAYNKYQSITVPCEKETTQEWKILMLDRKNLPDVDADSLEEV